MPHCPTNQPHFPLFNHPKIVLWIINTTKFVSVSFFLVAIYILPLIHTPSSSTLFSNTLSPCPSLPSVSSSPIFVFILQRDGWGPSVHKVLDGRYTEVGIASFIHASGCGCLTQRSSLESLVAWTRFRQTLVLWLLDWHQSEHKWIRYYWL